MVTHLAALLGWLARESRNPAAYAQVFALSWLALLLWQPTARLRTAQVAAMAGALELGLHVLAWAGISLWLTGFSTVLTAADVAMAVSPVLVAPFLAVRLIGKQRGRTGRTEPAVVTDVPEVAGVQAGSNNDFDLAWDVATLPVMRIPAAAVPVVAHNERSPRGGASAPDAAAAVEMLEAPANAYAAV